MIYSFIFGFLSAFWSVAVAPSPASVGEINLSGQWEGVFTQDRNGERVDFSCQIFIEQSGKKIKGKSVVHDADIHAEMTFEGKFVQNKVLRCQETSILRQETRPNMEWCLKSYDMVFKGENEMFKLEGLWEGITSFGACTPGRVYLKKVIPRA